MSTEILMVIAQLCSLNTGAKSIEEMTVAYQTQKNCQINYVNCALDQAIKMKNEKGINAVHLAACIIGSDLGKK